MNQRDSVSANSPSAIDDTTRQDLISLQSADIIVGIPSYNNAGTISRVIKAAELGLAKYFPQHRGVILVSEGGDIDATRHTIESLKDKHYFDNSFIHRPSVETGILATRYNGPSGKGTAIKAIFEAAKMLDVKAGCMLDSDLRSISPGWIELLIAPILQKDFGFVTPYYCRHKYDGTITNMIAYPLTWSLYGRRVRQPIGGDFGFSKGLIESLLSKDVWESDIARFGIDIWMTTVAICEQFTICQSYLGSKIHDDKDPGKDLSPMFKQVVGTIFNLMDIYSDIWLKVKGSKPTAIFGFESEFAPNPLHVDVTNMIRKFKDNVQEHLPVWEKVLEAENCRKILEVAKMEPSHFELPVEVWIRCLFDFALAYKKQLDGLSLNQIIDALVPIYYAKVASFVSKTINLDSPEAEEVINEQCIVFEKLKPYLLERWNEK
ncbi:MAG: hypothetical protein JSW20_09340 [Nitrospiraceae bacterium]|nr:MAG: hypothetical protein JSW20_09340 [Nitrospiraceae bacterium]